MTTRTVSRSPVASTAQGAPKVKPGDILFSSSSSYSVLELIGEGCFGVVTRCLNLNTAETVAVKIIKKTILNYDPEEEVCMLEAIRDLNLDLYNIVKFFERFEHQGHTCLALEMLDCSLEDRIQKRGRKPLSLQEIRPIAKQLLVALDALADYGILHADIKPDNVMFVSSWDHPLRIKLIDFGVAVPITIVRQGMILQPIGYRAPEIYLGLPITHSIDMWGLGCTLVYLYLGNDLFPVYGIYQIMKSMVQLLGQPEDRLLDSGVYTKKFFRKVEEADGPRWRLMTFEEYEAVTKVEPEDRISFNNMPSSLDDLVRIHPEREPSALEDRWAFAAFLKELLHFDWSTKISPQTALQQPFVSMAHLTSPYSRTYLATSKTMMKGCTMEESEDEGILPTSPPLPLIEEDAEAYLCDGESVRSCDRETSSLSCDFHLNSWSSEGEIPSQSPDDDLFSLGTHDDDEGISSQSPDDDLSLLGTHDDDKEISSQSSEEDIYSLGAYDVYEDAPAVESSVELPEIPDCTPASSAPSGQRRNLLSRIRRFFRRITASLCCCCRPNVED